MPIDATAEDLHWYAMYRGSNRKVTDMVVAWLTDAEVSAEAEKYARWDTRASGNTAGWEIERFPRRPRDSYFRLGGDQLIDYHLLLADRAQAVAERSVAVYRVMRQTTADR